MPLISALPFCCMKLFRCFLLTVSCNVYMKFDTICKQSGAWQLVDVARWGGGGTENQWVLLDFMVPFLHRWIFCAAVMWSACKIIFTKEKVLFKIRFALYLVIILAGEQSWSDDSACLSLGPGYTFPCVLTCSLWTLNRGYKKLLNRSTKKSIIN